MGFFRDSGAVEGLPMLLLIGAALAGAALVLAAGALRTTSDDACERAALEARESLRVRAEALYSGGAEGAEDRVQVRIPGCAAHIVLGALPPASGGAPGEREPGVEAGNLYYRLQNGATRMVGSTAAFTGPADGPPDERRPAVLLPGGYTVVLRLVRLGGVFYVHVSFS
ncbi:MAG: hypothetical protein HY558_06150 [Euryarchaeota archaeon]|nr:hypothetical protein [Euryarchaeota archaeon]